MNLGIKVFGHIHSMTETSYEKTFYKVINYIPRILFRYFLMQRKGL